MHVRSPGRTPIAVGAAVGSRTERSLRTALIVSIGLAALLGSAACVPNVGNAAGGGHSTSSRTKAPTTSASSATKTTTTAATTTTVATTTTTGTTTTATTTTATTTTATTTTAPSTTTSTTVTTTAPTATKTTTTTPSTTVPTTTTSAGPTRSGGLAAGVVPLPGQVGFLGDVASLRVIDGSASAPAGTRWTAGSLRVDGSNVTLDGVFVKGGIDFAGNGTLTIRNSIVEGAAPAWSAVLTRGGHLDMRDTTVRWRGGAPGASWGNGAVHGDATMTVLRCDISGAPDGVQNGPGNSLFEQNYIHGNALLGTYPNNTHNDGIQSYGGPGLVIRNNRIDIRDAQGRAYDGTHQNGAVFIQPTGGDAAVAPVITGNFLAGGGYTLRLEGPMSNAVVADNRFGPTTGAFGDVLASSGVTIAQWSNNVDDQGKQEPRP